MIDWRRVEELRDEIGPEDFLEVAGMFLEEADQTIDQLKGDIDTAEVESRLHFLKGSALNLGLSDLAAICQEGERLAAAGDAAKVDLARLIMVYHASRTAFMSSASHETAA